MEAGRGRGGGDQLEAVLPDSDTRRARSRSPCQWAVGPVHLSPSTSPVSLRSPRGILYLSLSFRENKKNLHAEPPKKPLISSVTAQLPCRSSKKPSVVREGEGGGREGGRERERERERKDAYRERLVTERALLPTKMAWRRKFRACQRDGSRLCGTPWSPRLAAALAAAALWTVLAHGDGAGGRGRGRSQGPRGCLNMPALRGASASLGPALRGTAPASLVPPFGCL